MKSKILISRAAVEELKQSLECLMTNNVPRSSSLDGLRGRERVAQWLALNKKHASVSPNSAKEAKSTLRMMKEERLFEIYLEVCEAFETVTDPSHDARVARVAACCVTPASVVRNGLIEYGLRYAEQYGYSAVVREISPPPAPARKRAA